jgi:hypothetical protein
MSFYLLHAGTTLQKSTVSGVLSNITLPVGVTMVDTRPARVAILANQIVVVNAVSRNIAINPATLATRLLCIAGPTAAADGAVSGAGQMIGNYRFGYTYAILDVDDTILTESPLSPITGPIATNNSAVQLTNVTVSGDAGVNARIIYQTVADGTDFYEVDRIEDNTTTTINLDTSDYDLALLPLMEGKGNPPGTDATDYLRLIVAWKDRLFASPHDNPDYLYISGNREIYSWSEIRRLTVPGKGEDETGITAFMARRDELVIAKRRKLWKLIGNDPSDFELVLIADGIGAVSQEACVVIRDTCYFLGEDGFYEYGPNGVVKLSREKVQPWFTTDTYFNRAYFSTAFAKYNQLYDKLEIHLAAAGATTINRWVELDLRTGNWFGIHKTDAFTPTCAGAMDDANGFLTPVIGSSDGVMYRQNQPTAADDDTAIDMDVTTKFHSGGAPDMLHYWGDLSIMNKIESTGTLTVTPTVGDLDASAQSDLEVDLTTDRTNLARLGYGRLCQLRFRNSELNQPVTIYGYEIPFFTVGKR